MRVVALLILVMGTALPLVADDERREVGGEREALTLEQLPEKVRTTIIKNARGAKVHELKRGTKKGRIVYTAEIKEKESETRIVVDADGNLVSVTTEKEDH